MKSINESGDFENEDFETEEKGGEKSRLKIISGKNIYLEARTTKALDDYPGILVNLINNGDDIPIVDVECDIIGRKIMINIWGNKEKSKQEILIDF